jgi:hypothetical protein
MELETDVAVNPSLRYRTSAAYAFESRECVESTFDTSFVLVYPKETLARY